MSKEAVQHIMHLITKIANKLVTSLQFQYKQTHMERNNAIWKEEVGCGVNSQNEEAESWAKALC